MIEPRYSLQVMEASPSNNVIKGMHFMAYRKLRSSWKLQLRAALGRAQLGQPPIDQALLLIERHSASAGLDWDNAYGGLKPVLDCLVLPSAKNPDGLGLVVDDSPRHMPFPPMVVQLSCARKAGRTRIQIYEYSPATLLQLVANHVESLNARA